MKTPADVSVCIIVKNEPFLEQCIKSIRPFVKEIVIVDTGSTDGTDVVAKRLADKFEAYSGCNDPQTGLIEDFSNARQRSFDLATQPWTMWVDADDIIEGGEHLVELTKNSYPDAVSFMFKYEYSYDEHGKCTCFHYRERLFSDKTKFHWINPVHEVVVPNDGVATSFIVNDDIVFKHRRQYSNKVHESGRNLRILRKYFEKVGDTDARQMYYLGLECYNNGFIDEAIKHLSKYVDISGWDDERTMACLKLVDIYQAAGDYDNGLRWALKAITLKETWGEGYFALGRMFYYLAIRNDANTQRNWERCVYFSRIGLGLPLTKTLLFINPVDRDFDIHRYLNVALHRTGDIVGALESAQTGLNSRPDDVALQTNKKIYEVWLAKQEVIGSVNKLREVDGIDDGELKLIQSIVERENNTSICKKCSATEESSKALSVNIESAPGVAINQNSLDIVFFAGDGVEVWTPETVSRTGIGGSELMLLEQAKRLAALGHKVRVFNSCGIFGRGVYDNVTYEQTDKFNNLTCDVLVVSRRADMLADHYNVTAKVKLLWVHDVCAIRATNDLLLKADRILALSDWHKQNIIKAHNVHQEHVLVTRNGIDLSRFNKNVPRNKFKCVNSSSPDRSWPILLSVWPRIKQQVPEAELHLYYGFKNWQYAAQFDKGQADLIEFLKNKIQEMRDLGVVYHDRVSQAKLAEEFLSAGCWIHPTWFTETSCITAMEAQAAGLGIVTSSIAALNETVGPRGALIDGDWTTPEYQEKFISAVVHAIKNTSDQDRRALQEYAAQNFGLPDLAKNWDEMFHGLIEKVTINPIPPYQPTEPYVLGRGYTDGDTRLSEDHPERRKNETTLAQLPVAKTEITLPRLNIGSGPNVFPFDGWINYDREDISTYLHYLDWQGEGLAYVLHEMPEHQQRLAVFIRSGGVVDFRVHDIRNGFAQHADKSVESIYIGQVIEHLNPIHEVPKLLKDCHRMLKDGGVIRMTTPDLDILIKAYLTNEMGKFASEQPDFYKDADPSAQLAMIMYGATGAGCTWTNYDGHMFLFTQKSMTVALENAGFKDITFYYETGISKDPVMAKQAEDAGMTHSFIVEAVK